MNEIQIHNDELSASVEEFKELEKLINTELPKEYKTFLQKHNGCTICPNVPTIKADIRHSEESTSASGCMLS